MSEREIKLLQTDRQTDRHACTHLMDLDPISCEFIVPSCVSINIINSINELNL